MKVLIGVDGSPCSRVALEFVRKLRLPAGSRVIVVTAVPPPVPYATMYVPVSASAEQLVGDMTKAREKLVSQAAIELRDAGFATEARVLQGDPREAIVEAATEEGADLVVTGSRGRTGIARLLLGSVAAHVVTHAPCSVLVVKRGRNGS